MSELEFDGKVLAITGAASGIGQACAVEAVRRGARVVLIDRDDCDRTRRRLGVEDDSMSFICDVRETRRVDEVFTEIHHQCGGLDVLINCAGTMGNWPKPLTDTSDEDWALVFDTNIKGMFATCRAALPMLRKREGTAIVNVASELGLVGTTGLVIYGASKAAVNQLSRALAVEEASHGIRVNSVCPGPVDTPFLIAPGDRQPERRAPGSTTLLGRLGTPEEIAEVVLFVASSKASFMTGSVIVVDGGVTAHD